MKIIDDITDYIFVEDKTQKQLFAAKPFTLGGV